MDISSLYKIYTQHPVVTTDSRNILQGAIFFALKGVYFDGNEFAEEALDGGCSYAIVDNEKYVTRPNILLVENSMQSLLQLANYHRRIMKTPVIAIAGTNGKTTTKELITEVLLKEHKVLASDSNYNNVTNMALTLLRLRKEHEIAIIEMSANNQGDISELCRIAEPNYGLITNIGHAHIESFGNFENLVKAKKELYDYIAQKDEGKIFVNYDNLVLREISQDMPAIYYGLDSEHEQFVTGKVISANPHLIFEWKMARKYHTVETKLLGDYNLPNALAAITIGKYFGIKGDLICEAIASYQPDLGRTRLERTKKGNMLLIDAYNANPASMMAALHNFDQMTIKHKALILGEMKELGPDSVIEHQKVIDYIADHDFEKVMLVGDNFKYLNSPYPAYSDSEELKNELNKNPLRDYYILLKGARPVQLDKAVEAL